MHCPFCGFDNIEGVDQCARCDVDLTDPNTVKDRSEIELDLLDRPLGELIADDYLTVGPDAPVREVIAQLNERGHHCAVVVDGDGDGVVGIFTERDVLNRLVDCFDARGDEPIREFMTPDPATLEFDDAIAFGLNRMTVGGYRHIPITRDGKVAGVVSVRHIIDYLVDRFPIVLGAGAAG